MKRRYDFFLSAIAGLGIGWLLCGLLVAIPFAKNSYKRGQEDALNGKWQYEYRADTLLYEIEKP